MKGNIYTDKYSNKPEEGNNLAVSSIAACERAMSRISTAKNFLLDGDRKNWFLELGKLPEEIGELQRIVKDPRLGQWGHDMQVYYLNLSLLNNKVILEDPKDPSVADEILGEFVKIRDYWKEALQNASNDSGNDQEESDIGGLI